MARSYKSMQKRGFITLGFGGACQGVTFFVSDCRIVFVKIMPRQAAGKYLHKKV